MIWNVYVLKKKQKLAYKIGKHKLGYKNVPNTKRFI